MIAPVASKDRWRERERERRENECTCPASEPATRAKTRQPEHHSEDAFPRAEGTRTLHVARISRVAFRSRDSRRLEVEPREGYRYAAHTRTQPLNGEPTGAKRCATLRRYRRSAPTPARGATPGGRRRTRPKGKRTPSSCSILSRYVLRSSSRPSFFSLRPTARTYVCRVSSAVGATRGARVERIYKCKCLALSSPCFINIVKKSNSGDEGACTEENASKAGYSNSSWFIYWYLSDNISSNILFIG